MIHPTAIIGPNVEIGKNVTIGPYAVIGQTGFFFTQAHDLSWDGTKMSENLGVSILDDVYIGAHTVIDAGCVTRRTHIGKGAKIDSHCMIGHDCHVGDHVLMSGQVGLASGAYISNYCVLFGQVGVANWKAVGPGKVILGKAGVTTHLMDENEKVYMGHPAVPLKDWSVWWRAFKASVKKRKSKLKKRGPKTPFP